MNLELKLIGSGIKEIAQVTKDIYSFPSAVKVSEIPEGHKLSGGSGVGLAATMGATYTAMIAIGSGAILGAFTNKETAFAYITTAMLGGYLTNIVSGISEYKKILKKRKVTINSF